MKPIAIVFPGQGSQAVGMGRALYEADPRARELYERADRALGWSVSKLCFEGPEEELKLTRNTQPALLVTSVAAATLLGAKPAVAAGHSLGEYAAMVLAGALTLEDAVVLVHRRGGYMQEAVPVGVGGMTAVLGADPDAVRAAVAQVASGTVEVANWNSRDQVVLSGHAAAVAEAVAILKPPRAVPLAVSAPFHSRLMAPAEERLAADLERTPFRDLEFPVVVNVDAKPVRTGAEARDALRRQVSRPVLWLQSMESLADAGLAAYVECGPGKVLTGLMKKISRGWPTPPAFANVEDPESLAKARAIL